MSLAEDRDLDVPSPPSSETAVEPDSGPRLTSIPELDGLPPEVRRALMEQTLYSDEPEMDSDVHREQIELLIGTLKRFWRNRSDFYCSGNLTIFYTLAQFALNPPFDEHGQLRRAPRKHCGPDFFVVLGADPELRSSWVAWREGGRLPNAIVEVLSHSTKHIDRGPKMTLYQDVFRTPEYFLFDPYKARLKGHRRVDGRYRPIEPDAAGRLPSREMDLLLGVQGRQLRFFTRDGHLLLSDAEHDALSQQDAAQARQDEARARQDEARARQDEALARQDAARARQEK